MFMSEQDRAELEVLREVVGGAFKAVRRFVGKVVQSIKSAVVPVSKAKEPVQKPSHTEDLSVATKANAGLGTVSTSTTKAVFSTVAVLGVYWFFQYVGIAVSLSVLSAGLTAAVVVAFANRFHPLNSFHAAYLGFLVTGFNPIGLIVGYLATLLLSAARTRVLLPAIVVLAVSSVLFPIIPLPVFPIGGLILIVISFPYLKIRTKRVGVSIEQSVELMPSGEFVQRALGIVGRILLLIGLLSVSPLLSGGASGVVMVIFSFAALGINASESVTNGFANTTKAERQAKEEKLQTLLNPVKEGNAGIMALAALIFSLMTMGVGAGSTAKRWGLSDKWCFLLETIVEGFNLKALLLLGEVLPARTSLADLLLNLDTGWISMAGEGIVLSQVALPFVIFVIVLSLVVFLKLAALYGVAVVTAGIRGRERALSIFTVTVLSGFNPIATALSLGSAWVAQRYLEDEVRWTMPLIGALVYKPY